jgi:hypothetical protein
LEKLVWNGIVTNDSFSIARYYMDNDKKNSPWLKYNTYPNMGRWYKTSGYMYPKTVKAIPDYINEILDRYGIISKEIMECEKGVCRWSDIYTWLKNNEFTSGIKRGLYISGLSGIQFARDRDIEQIRMQESCKADSVYTVLCSCDPANPYKDILSKASPEKITKNQGTAVVFLNGTPVLIVREFGGSLQPVTNSREILVNATAGFIDAFQSRMLWTGRKSIYTEYWRESAGEGGLCKIEDSPLYERLLDLGFERGYSGITLWRRSV